MERIPVNPERLRWCCADRGIAPEHLTAELGVSATNVELALSGAPGFTYNQLSRVADYFGRGILFFLDPSRVIDEHVHTPAFRTLANQKPELSAKVKSLIERVEKQRTVYLALRDEVEGNDLPNFTPPDLPKDNIKMAAAVTRKWLGLGEVNDFEAYRNAVESKGILVFRSNGYQGKWQIAKESPILGFTLYDVDCPVIVIKKQYWEAQQNFTLMHEVAHLLLHKNSSIDDENDMHAHAGHEQEANAFAGHILVPDAFLVRIDDDSRPQRVEQFDEWLAWCKKAWGVSAEVVLRRLKDNGRLSQSDYTKYRNWRASLQIDQSDSGSRAWRHREPRHIFGDTFVRTVLGALSGRRITLAKASNYLDGLKVSDLHLLERHYAGL